MKEYFRIILLIVAVSFFSAHIVFEKKRGFFRFAGLEIFVLGIIFSFAFPGESLLKNLYPFIALALSFAGLSFGIQFRREFLQTFTPRHIFFAFIISLNFFLLLFLLRFLFPFSTAVSLSTIFSIPSSYILFSMKRNKTLVLSSELNIVMVLIYYGIAMYGFKGFLISMLLGASGFLVVLFEHVLKKDEFYILLLGFSLLIASFSQLFNASVIVSAFFMGFITAFFSVSNCSSSLTSRIEKPLFLSLLFSSGLCFHFTYSISFLIFFLTYPFIRFFAAFLLFKRKSVALIPIGALSIALSIETKSSSIITFTAISYFILLALFELIEEKWAI